jgi:hypothetical protein
MPDPDDTKLDDAELNNAANEPETNTEELTELETEAVDRSKVSAIRRVRAGSPRHLRNPEPNPAAPVTVAPLVSIGRAQDQADKKKAEEETRVAQRELTREQAQRVIAARIAEAQFDAVKRDLDNARRDIATVTRSRAREHRIALIGLLAILLAGAFYIYRSTTGIPVDTSPSPAAFFKPKMPESAQPEAYGPQVEFARGLDRLNYTLALAASGRPGDTPEYAIRKVHAMNPALCPFLWKNGQVSFIFSGGNLTLTSLSDMFSRCADAVAQLH